MSNIECTGTIDIANNIIKVDTLDTDEIIIDFHLILILLI